MQINQEPLGKNVEAPEPSTPFEASDWAMQVLESGEELDEVVEHVMFLELVSLLRATGGDESCRYKALAEMHKFAKLLEQKRSRKERTENQKRRLDLVQAAQEIKLREIKLRETRMTSQPAAQVQKSEPTQFPNKANEPIPPKLVPPNPVPPGIAQESTKLERPSASQPEQPQKEASREVGTTPAAKPTRERFQRHRSKARRSRFAARTGGYRKKPISLRSSPVPSWVLRGKRKPR